MTPQISCYTRKRRQLLIIIVDNGKVSVVNGQRAASNHVATSTNQPVCSATVWSSTATVQPATSYLQLEQQPATMQQVVQPQQAPIVQAAPIQDVNQVAPQQQAVYAPQYQPKPLQLQGQAPQYHGNQVAYSAQQGGVAQIIMVSIVYYIQLA